MSWLMHLFLTVITAGLWLIVWGILFLWHIIITPLINNPNLDIISYGKNRCKKINT